MGLTQFALEHLGFRRRRDDESLTAAFSCVCAFEVQGVSPSSGLLIEAKGTVDAVDYHLALSDTLNAAAQRVALDDFVDDEPAWAAEQKCSPPYLLIVVGPTETHAMTGDFLKEDTSGLQTHDAFVPARRELREMEGKVIPSLLSALSCTFATLENPVRFRKLDRAVLGKSADGKTVFDFGFEVRGEMRVGKTVATPDLQDLVGRATKLTARMNPNISKFYYLALMEQDSMKRFLHLFLTIERQTHAVFKSTEHGLYVANMFRVPPRVQATGTSFFGTQHARWNSLQERFMWCALTVWTHLTDDDVDNFSKVKKVRDQLAHGEIAAPSVEAVELVERVAAKLQLAPHGADG
jgi:hypothetical protein